MSVALRYQQAIQKPPGDRITATDRLQAIDPRYHVLARERRRWPSAGVIGLPEVTLPCGPAQDASDLGHLAVLLA